MDSVGEPLVPAIISNLQFELNGQTIPPERTLRLLEELVPARAFNDKRSLAEKLAAAQWSEVDYYDLVTQESFKRLLFDYAYFKILFPKIPAVLDVLATAIDAGKESYLRHIIQILSAYHSQLTPAPAVLEKHEHIHLASLTPDQLAGDLQRIEDINKRLMKTLKKDGR